MNRNTFVGCFVGLSIKFIFANGDDAIAVKKFFLITKNHFYLYFGKYAYLLFLVFSCYIIVECFFTGWERQLHNKETMIITKPIYILSKKSKLYRQRRHSCDITDKKLQTFSTNSLAYFIRTK